MPSLCMLSADSCQPRMTQHCCPPCHSLTFQRLSLCAEVFYYVFRRLHFHFYLTRVHLVENSALNRNFFEYTEHFECFGIKIMVVGTEFRANPACNETQTHSSSCRTELTM